MQKNNDNNTVDIATAAALLGVSQRHVRRLCRSGKLAGAATAPGWVIPRTANAKLIGVKSPDQLSASLDTSAIPPEKLQQAVYKRGLLDQCEAFCAVFVRQGGQRSAAMAAFARRADKPVRTLQRWRRQYQDKGLAGLIDNRGRGDSLGPVISPDAWNEFLSLYLDLRQPTVTSCLRNIDFINRQQNKGWTIPGLRTLQNYVNDHIPMPVAVLHREGLAAYEAKCAPYIETDMDSIEPGAVWIGDHHQCDCWVRYRGKWIRPWLTVWEDMRSRVIVGVKVTASPNSTTILQAFRAGVERFGPPESVKIDNGKDYDSQMWTGVTKTQRLTKQVRLDETLVAGLYAMMNVSVSFAIPYHPQAKAIERWFDTLEGQFVKTIPTYCGKDTNRRPEDLWDYLKTGKAVDEAMELNDFAEVLAQYIEVYNHTAHTGRGMNGSTPIQMMAHRTARRVMDASALDLLLRNWTSELTVGKNGVTVKGLTYGKYDAALMMHQGRKVRCSYDAEDMSQISVYDANSYQLLAIAEQSSLVGYGAAASEEDLREAMRAKTKATRTVKQYKPASRIANTDLTSLTIAAMAERTVEPTKPDTPAAIKPVATVMDQNIKLHRTLVNQKKVRRAAGGESVTHVAELTLDYDIQRPTDDGPELTLEAPRKQTQQSAPKLTLFNG